VNMTYNLYQSILVDTGIRVQLDVVPLCMYMYVYVYIYSSHVVDIDLNHTHSRNFKSGQMFVCVPFSLFWVLLWSEVYIVPWSQTNMWVDDLKIQGSLTDMRAQFMS
jgi:hypothetical protein